MDLGQDHLCNQPTVYFVTVTRVTTESKNVPKKGRKNAKKSLDIQKSRIQDTKHLSTDADSSTNTKKILLVRLNWLKNKLAFARQFYTL